jgi:hypothetical protein
MVDSITERARPVSLAAASDARARLDHDIRGLIFTRFNGHRC